MGTTLTRSMMTPSLFDDFFKPWNEWFDKPALFERMMTMPAVNVGENMDNYIVSLAAPGLKKEDFKIGIEGNMLTISCEKELEQEEQNVKFTRKEYNFYSFSRSFTIPEDVKLDFIDAHYENGVLNIMLPRLEETKKLTTSKTIAVN
ncbi:MAG TPA: Hsp20/alpha crystallin family protein [Flavisolibacter sp.]|jgi:HSP20 family protein|nr:Hsp20/alpha crystallin family protein [Flavisolibacter sp.]